MSANRHGLFAKITALLLCITLLFLTGVPAVYADEYDDALKKIEELNKQIREKEKQLSVLSKDKSQQQQLIRTLNAQRDNYAKQLAVIESSLTRLGKDIKGINSSISGYENDILHLTEKISQTEAEITSKEAQAESTRLLAQERMRASYVSGSPSKLEILLSSEDMSAFFFNLELLKQLARRDQELIDKLKEEVAALRTLKKGLEEDKVRVEKVKSDLNVKLSDLKVKKSEQDNMASKLSSAQKHAMKQSEQAKSEIAKLDKTSALYREQLKQYEREREEADRFIENYLKEHGSSGSGQTPPDDTGLKFPVPYSRVYYTALYPRYPSGGVHHGIDICVEGGSYGKNIVAVQAGTVLIAGWGNSYGNYVLIDHGNGFSTLYAHASRLVVSKGQTVTKGQKIAEIGSTGNSTGPHLHFETRVNGTRIDPLKYYPNKKHGVGKVFSGL